MQQIDRLVAERAPHRQPIDVRFPWTKQRQAAVWLALFACALSVKGWGQITSVLTRHEDPKIQGSRIQAITHVTVIDPGSGGDEQRDMTIIFRDSMILAVEKSAQASIPLGTAIHDEHGRYVMPGLWDAHVHLTQVGPKAFPLFLANGITSVRDMGSDLIEIREWQEARSQGALIPRILTPGPKLDGMTYEESLHAEYRPDRFVVTSPETARAIIDALLKAHVNFIKVHNGMAAAIYDAIAKEAHAVGLPFDGHLPEAGPLAAAAAGQRTLEHGQHMMLCSESDWKKIHTEPANRAADEETWCANPDVQAKMFPAIIRAGEWLTPTLTVWRSGDMIGRPNAKVLAAKLSGSATVWPELQQWWDSEMGSPPFTDFQRSLLEKAPAMAAAASRAGVKLLAGTDLGDPYVIPGYSLHDELELMVAAGVPTLKALQSATSEPSLAFGLSATVGTIAPGQSADLLVLNADPLQDISNTSRICAVVFNGNWVPQGAEY
jgi:imidazolonepropionase-like amidohydrolase